MKNKVKTDRERLNWLRQQVPGVKYSTQQVEGFLDFCGLFTREGLDGFQGEEGMKQARFLVWTHTDEEIRELITLAADPGKIRFLTRYFPYPKDYHVIAIKDKRFVFENQEHLRLSKSHYDCLKSLGTAKDLENPVYVSIADGPEKTLIFI